MARLDAFFKLMFDSGASDLHITSAQPPILRVHGELERVKYDPMDDETLRAMLYESAPHRGSRSRSRRPPSLRTS